MTELRVDYRGEHAVFPVEEYRNRYDQLRKKMAEKELDAIVLTSKENVVYFSGLETVGWVSKHRPLGLILPQDSEQPVLVVPETLAYVAEATSWIEDVRLWGGFKVKDIPPNPVGAIIHTLESLGLASARLGMELGYGTRLAMTVAEYEELQKALPQADFVDGAAVCWDIRMIKSPAELEIMRTVCRETSEAFEVGFGSMRAGMTEAELAGILYAEMARRTNNRGGFIGIRAGKLKYSMMNVPPFPTNTLEVGDLVVVDGGAEYKDYRADMMRMASIGEPTAQQQHFFDVDLAAQKAGLAKVRAGVAAREIPAACHEVINDAGLGEHAPSLERVGHGLGLDVHEPPSLAMDNDMELKSGMVLAVEPIFSDLPNYEIGNFAMEQNIVVTDDGYELLTPMDDGLWVIDDSEDKK